MTQTRKVFVTAGHNRPFERLLRLVEPMAHDPRFELFAQMGHAADAFPNLPGRGFLDKPEFERRMDWADVVISQGGSGAIHDARRRGHLPIVVPRRAALGEHINDHQWDMAVALAEMKQICIYDDATDMRELVLRHGARAEGQRELRASLVETVRQQLECPDSKRLQPAGIVSAAHALFARLQAVRISNPFSAAKRPARFDPRQMRHK